MASSKYIKYIPLINRTGSYTNVWTELFLTTLWPKRVACDPREPRGIFCRSLVAPREIPLGTKSVGSCSSSPNSKWRLSYSNQNILDTDQSETREYTPEGDFVPRDISLGASNERQNIPLDS